MNIFALSKSPSQSAIEMLDKHVVKMPTETCQMLHTNILYMQYVSIWDNEPQLKDLKAFHKNTSSELMKPAMLNHPSTIWARQSLDNFEWLFEHGLALCDEYTHRYGKCHGSFHRIHDCHAFQDTVLQHNYPHSGLTPVIIAMFDKYRLDEKEYYNRNPNAKDWDFVIASYRHYYLEGKWQFAEWKTQRPNWWPKNHITKKHNERIVRYNALGKTQLKLRKEE